MIRKIFIFLLISLSDTTTIVAQNFGISLQSTTWKGNMLHNDNTFISTYNNYNNIRINKNKSIILSLNYHYNLHKKLDVVFSTGHAFGFKIIPLNVNFNFKISGKISTNIGIGIYMITDDSYNDKGQRIKDTEERTEPAITESGVNFGMSYKLTSNIALTSNYNILKNDEDNFNGISFGLSFTPKWGATIKQQNQWMLVDL